MTMSYHCQIKNDGSFCLVMEPALMTELVWKWSYQKGESIASCFAF